MDGLRLQLRVKGGPPASLACPQRQAHTHTHTLAKGLGVFVCVWGRVWGGTHDLPATDKLSAQPPPSRPEGSGCRANRNHNTQTQRLTWAEAPTKAAAATMRLKVRMVVGGGGLVAGSSCVWDVWDGGRGGR